MDWRFNFVRRMLRQTTGDGEGMRERLLGVFFWFHRRLDGVSLM